MIRDIKFYFWNVRRNFKKIGRELAVAKIFKPFLLGLYAIGTLISFLPSLIATILVNFFFFVFPALEKKCEKTDIYEEFLNSNI